MSQKIQKMIEEAETPIQLMCSLDMAMCENLLKIMKYDKKDQTQNRKIVIKGTNK